MCRLSPPNTPNKLRANKRMGPLTLPKAQIIVPFAHTVPIRIQIANGSGEGSKMKTVKPSAWTHLGKCVWKLGI